MRVMGTRPVAVLAYHGAEESAGHGGMFEANCVRGFASGSGAGAGLFGDAAGRAGACGLQAGGGCRCDGQGWCCA